MPFKSKSQRKFMWAKHPIIARKWEEESKENETKEHAKSNEMYRIMKSKEKKKGK